jgi:DNA-binding GntR family transcriptional regulator
MSIISNEPDMLKQIEERRGGRTRSQAVKAVRRVTTASAIHEHLLDEILSLQLPPGTALQEKLIAEEFGVSRTPVREAIIRLAEAGLVDIFPQSGTFVSRVPVNAIPEAVMIRKALEGATVETAAEAAGAAGVTRLDAIIARQRTLAGAGDTGAFHEADEAFHEAIADVSGHPGVWKLLKQVKVQIDRARRLTLPVLGRMDLVIAEHVIIRDAIAARDPAAARAAMMIHLSAVIPDIGLLVEQYPDYFAS